MRRKIPSQNNGGTGAYAGPHKKPRYNPGGGGDRQQNGMQHSYNNQHHNRPRKNYGASREKYLTNARDALASGDRVLAENYFQHADHCYRMMMEEAANQPRPRYTPPPTQNAEEPTQEQNGSEAISEETNGLPAFLTVNYDHTPQPTQPPVEEPVWENTSSEE